MRERKLTIAELALIVGTRFAFGIGIGLLIAGRLNRDQRKAAGSALAILAGLTTIPLGISIAQKEEPEKGWFKRAA